MKLSGRIAELEGHFGVSKDEETTRGRRYLGGLSDEDLAAVAGRRGEQEQHRVQEAFGACVAESPRFSVFCRKWVERGFILCEDPMEGPEDDGPLAHLSDEEVERIAWGDVMGDQNEPDLGRVGGPGID